MNLAPTQFEPSQSASGKNPIDKLLVRFLLGMIQFYRWFLVPFLRAITGSSGSCRFIPSCSEYARQALLLHGPWKGMVLSFGRLARCHPWGGFGFDPVPPPRQPKTPSIVRLTEIASHPKKL